MRAGLHVKDVRNEAERMESLGWEYDGADSKGHAVFVHPTFGRCDLPATPSSRFWRKDFRSKLARKMGMSVFQLERQMAGQALTVVKRERGPGRASEVDQLVARAEALGLGCDESTARRVMNEFGGYVPARRALEAFARGEVPDRPAPARDVSKPAPVRQITDAAEKPVAEVRRSWEEAQAAQQQAASETQFPWRRNAA